MHRYDYGALRKGESAFQPTWQSGTASAKRLALYNRLCLCCAMPYAPFTYKAANDPEHWRLRAEEARAVAEAFINPHDRERLMKITECYDRLAELAAKGPFLPPDARLDR